MIDRLPFTEINKFFYPTVNKFAIKKVDIHTFYAFQGFIQCRRIGILQYAYFANLFALRSLALP